jgi:hypothetical protein
MRKAPLIALPPVEAVRPGAPTMLDVILVAAGIGFFAIAVLYVLACDRM